MTAPTIPLYTGIVPQRTQSPSDFATNADNWLTYQSPLAADYNGLATYLDNLAVTVGSDALSAATSETNAAASALISQSNANFKGYWSSLTGSLSIPTSVFHNGTNWQLLNNIADVTLSEPSVTTDWSEIGKSTNTPTNATPAASATDISLTPTLTASAYSGTDTHEHSIFQVSTDNTFATVDYDSGILGNVISHTVTSALTAELVYYWRVKYIGINSDSGWSTATSFTTTVALSSIFATTLYTGTGATLNVVTGIDSTARNSLVWAKNRNAINQHVLTDTVRGATKTLVSNSTGTEFTDATQLSAFLANGFTVETAADINANGATYVAWQFAKQAGFFDIVTYTGDGVAGRTIPHSLGTTFGMTIVKNRDVADDWYVQHKDIPATNTVYLDLTAATSVDSTAWNNTSATTTDITLGSTLNGGGRNFIAYIFAHNPAKGIFCGSYTGTGAAGNKITTGFPVGWVMIKGTSLVSNWYIYDNTRGGVFYLNPDAPSAEGAAALGTFDVDGITINSLAGAINNIGNTYIFMAIADPAQF